jgi:hypothetical protein
MHFFVEKAPKFIILLQGINICIMFCKDYKKCKHNYIGLHIRVSQEPIEQNERRGRVVNTPVSYSRSPAFYQPCYPD